MTGTSKRGFSPGRGDSGAIPSREYGAEINRKNLLARVARGGVANVRFADFQDLVEGLGFELRPTSGSHHIYVHADLPELVNLEDVGGQAKPYQGRQVLAPGRTVRFAVERRLVSDYHINVFYSEEDGGYIADVPDLEACSAFG